NYFFVRIIPRDRIRVLDLSGVVSIISSAGKLLPVQEEYMTALRDGLLVHKMEPHPDIEVGERVRINSGPLTGAQGILERRKNELRVVLRLEMLARSVSVEVAATQIELCAPRDHDVRNSWSTKRSSLPPGTELADPDSTSVWGTTLRPIRNSEAAFCVASQEPTVFRNVRGSTTRTRKNFSAVLAHSFPSLFNDPFEVSGLPDLRFVGHCRVRFCQ